MLNINEELPLCAIISNLKTWQLTGFDTENSPVFNENFKNMVLIFIHWAGSNSKLTTPSTLMTFLWGLKEKDFKQLFLIKAYLCLTVLWTLLGQGVL